MSAAMKKRKYQTILINLTTLILLGVVIFVVFGRDYRSIFRCIGSVSVWGLLLLSAMGIGYQLLDALACLILIRGQLPAFRFRQAVGITYLGIFANVVTFSAGNVPLQSYELSRYGMNFGSGFGTLTLKYVFHKTAVFLYGVMVLLFHRHFLRSQISGLLPLVYAGFGVCAVLILVLGLLCTSGRVRHLFHWLLGKLPEKGKWIRWKTLWHKNLEALYSGLRENLKNRGMCVKVFLLDLIKLFLLCTIPWCTFRLLGNASAPFGEMQVLSAMMLLLVGVIPGVAGIGPTEITFWLLFTSYFGRVQTASALVLYRAATYFFPFLISIGVFAWYRRKQRR